MKLLMKLVLSAIAVIILAKLLPGVTLDDTFTTPLIVAFILAILNVLVKPILIILTLPITILTLGLFLLVVNALIILLADKLIDGFQVSSIWTAILFSLLLSFLQSILYSVLKEDKK
ncbi:phage holin family protein [Pontimicrobium aquaticum]|uniref:Phage holin family protein n=1 Tax=Pontimicrobium aquaticum TaxID=2565367 RepID=A0A4V5LPS3_9FLAO|nr:phage holin family protein [Pontimicrobium aquaticum]TJY32499.1 phage holin family protein [Pontimicrobium aquaticum]